MSLIPQSEVRNALLGQRYVLEDCGRPVAERQPVEFGLCGEDLLAEMLLLIVPVFVPDHKGSSHNQGLFVLGAKDAGLR